MNVFRGFSDFSNRVDGGLVPNFDRNVGSVVVVGSFDGVHSGHRRLIEQVNECALRLSLQPIVITFDPHPRQVLRGDNRLLSTIDERLMLLEEAHVKNLIVVEFSKEFAAIEADVFASQFLKKTLRAQVVFTGEGHTFGRNRGGDEEVILKNEMQIVHIERYDDISSTKIRSFIQEGEMEMARELLASHYLVVTPVDDPSKLLPTKGRFLCEVGGQELVLDGEQIKQMRPKMILYIKKRL